MVFIWLSKKRAQRLIFFVAYIRFGRDTFAEAMKISGRAESSKINWGAFKYMVFDIPNHEGTYEERYSKLGKLPMPE